MWRITVDRPADAGIFSVTDSGEQSVTVAADFFGADAIGMSIEPQGGSPQPIGAERLAGQPLMIFVQDYDLSGLQRVTAWFAVANPAPGAGGPGCHK